MKNSAKWVTIIALSVVINIVGSKLSGALSLPIYLDSIGTIMAGTIIGPGSGILVALVGGLVNGALGDIYSIYFSVSGMIMGLMAGLLLHNKKLTWVSVFWKTFFIVLPASFVSSIIEVVLFDGVTTALFTTTMIRVLSATVMSMFSSAFLIQLITDYFDKLVAVILTKEILKRMPYDMVHMSVKKK